MEAPPDLSNAPPPPATVSGKLVVLGLIASGLLFGAAATYVRLSNHDRISAFQRQALPTLVAETELTCERPDGSSTTLHKGDRCGTDATLVLVPGGRGVGTTGTVWALLSEQGVRTGLVDATTPTRISLGGEPVGPHALALVIANQPLDPASVREALAAVTEPGVAPRLAALDAFVARALDQTSGLHLRAERRELVIGAQ